MIGRFGASQTTEYEGIIPSYGAGLPAFDRESPEGVIMAALAPLHGALEAALGAGDDAGALDLACNALANVASELAVRGGAFAGMETALVHSLAVELQSLPFAAHHDGTLEERGLRVRVAYQNWQVGAADAATIQRCIAHRWGASPVADDDSGGDA